MFQVAGAADFKTVTDSEHNTEVKEHCRLTAVSGVSRGCTFKENARLAMVIFEVWLAIGTLKPANVKASRSHRRFARPVGEGGLCV